MTHEKHTFQIDEIPDKNVIYLDTVGSQQFLANIISHEVWTVDNGKKYITKWDEDDEYAFLANEADIEDLHESIRTHIPRYAWPAPRGDGARQGVIELRSGPSQARRI